MDGMMRNVDWTARELLPHDPPMVLIDEVVAWSEDCLEAAVQIGEDSPFASGLEGVPSWAGIEYMAQSIAALAGVRAKMAGNPIRVGYLVGTRKFTSDVPSFTTGSMLSIHIEEVFEDNNMGVYDCSITDQTGNGLASARLNVYLPPEFEQDPNGEDG